MKILRMISVSKMKNEKHRIRNKRSYMRYLTAHKLFVQLKTSRSRWLRYVQRGDKNIIRYDIQRKSGWKEKRRAENGVVEGYD